MIKYWNLLFCVLLFHFGNGQTDTINIHLLERKFLNEEYLYELIFFDGKLYSGFYEDYNDLEKIYARVELGELKEINTYNKDNVIIKNEVFRYGGLSEEINYFNNGNVLSKGLNFQNLKHGIWKFYNNEGELKAKKNFQNGKEISMSTLFDINGRKLTQYDFDNRMRYKNYKKIKLDTISFKQLNRKFEKCLKVSKVFDNEEYTFQDSLQFCNQVFYKKRKLYSGYVLKESKDTLYFIFNGEYKFLKIFEDGDLLNYMTLDRKGNLQGVFYEFYPTGRIKTKGFYSSNRKYGYFYDYYDNGGLRNRFYGYINDSPAGHWYFYYLPNGLQSKIEIYKNGKIHTAGYEYYDEKRNKYTDFYGPTGEINFHFVEDQFGIPFKSIKYENNEFMDIDVLDENGRTFNKK